MTGPKLAAAVRLVKNSPGTEDSNDVERSGKPRAFHPLDLGRQTGSQKVQPGQVDPVTGGGEHVVDRDLLLATRGGHRQLHLVARALGRDDAVPVQDGQLADHPVLEPPGAQRASTRLTSRSLVSTGRKRNAAGPWLKG